MIAVTANFCYCKDTSHYNKFDTTNCFCGGKTGDSFTTAAKVRSSLKTSVCREKMHKLSCCFTVTTISLGPWWKISVCGKMCKLSCTLQLTKCRLLLAAKSVSAETNAQIVMQFKLTKCRCSFRIVAASANDNRPRAAKRFDYGLLPYQSHSIFFFFFLVNDQFTAKGNWVPAGAAGEFSSLELTSCADSYSVSAPPLCNRSGT